MDAQALIDSLRTQRNAALDQVAELHAVNASLGKALAEKDARIAELEKQDEVKD